jgi:hypothetical protein
MRGLSFFSGQDPDLKSLAFNGSTTQNPFGSTPGKLRLSKFNLLVFPLLRAFFWWPSPLFFLEMLPLISLCPCVALAVPI